MMDFGETFRTSSLWCWGRVHPTTESDNFNGPSWNPLAAEMMVAGTVVSESWETDPPRRREGLTNALGLSDEETARIVWAFLAGVSRVGEANPGRMNGFGGTLPGTRWSEERRAWHGEALLAGLPLYPLTVDLLTAAPEHITAATLPRLLGCDCSDVMNGEECPDHHELTVTAHALNLFEGHALHPEKVDRSQGAADPRWDGVRSDLVDLVAAHVGIDRTGVADLLRPSGPEALSFAGALIGRANRRARNAIDHGGGNFCAPTDGLETLSSHVRELVREELERERKRERELVL